MNYSELIKEYNKILSFISDKRIADAFALLDKLAEKCFELAIQLAPRKFKYRYNLSKLRKEHSEIGGVRNKMKK